MTLFLFSISVASNSVVSNLETEIIDVDNDQECYAVCSQGIYNTETGETATVTSIGHSYLSCDMAAAICQKNLKAKLKKVLE